MDFEFLDAVDLDEVQSDNAQVYALEMDGKELEDAFIEL